MSRGQLTQLVFTIADGETVSDAQDVRDVELVAFVIPPGYTTADLTLQARMHPRNNEDARVSGALSYLDVVDSSGAAVTITADADQYIVPTPALLCALYGCSEVKLVAASAQTGDQGIVAIVQPR